MERRVVNSSMANLSAIGLGISPPKRRHFIIFCERGERGGLTHVHLKCYITSNMSPLISEFDGLKVRMNELDHEPTHVHVVYQGKSVFVDLVKMEITKGALPKRQAVTLLAWCEHNKTVLMRNWKNRLKPGGIVKVPPPSWK